MSDAAAPRKQFVRAKKKIDAAIVSIVFAVAVTISIIILTALLVAQSYRDQFSRAEATAESDAHIVAVHTQWVIEASLQSLERIRDTLARQDNWAGRQSFGDLDEMMSGLPAYVRISVYGPRGNLRLSNADNPEAVNVAELSYFENLQNGASLIISPMLLEEDGGQGGFIVGRRLELEGEFMGVAAITVSNSMLSDVWRSLDLEAGSTISLVRDDGWIVARYPAPEEVISLKDYELFTDHLAASPQGTYSAEASPVDGAARMVGYRRLEGLPVIALAAISTDAVIARFWRNASVALALTVPGLLGLLTALWWLLKTLKRDRKTREQLANALEQNQVLFREIHHRVKNNLQAVSSLVQLQPVSPAVKGEMGRRIAAMVAVHEHIYRTDQFDSAEASEYLEKLVTDIVAGFDTSAQVNTELAPVHVHRDHLMPLGLIVNEALCNAIKYAFPDGRAGTIDVVLERIDATHARLRIKDNGIGFDPAVPSEGMGRRLVLGLAQQIGGELAYETCEAGSVLVLTFPIETIASSEAQESLA